MIPLFKHLQGSHEYEILQSMDKTYSQIESAQKPWEKASQISCPNGCGKCCVHFEPDLNKGEALYLAAWLIENKPKMADAIFEGTFKPSPGVFEDGCILFDPDSNYHCRVYDGRALICRLFGYSGDYGKQEEHRWKPCKFLPQELLKSHKPALEHRQYEESELKEIFDALPPAMSDFTEQSMELDPDEEANTEPLRVALPKAIGEIEFLLYAMQGKDPDAGDLPFISD